MKNRIQSLTLKNFRGASTPFHLDFDNNKPITVIFGENGTGKSTIVDAIDFCCNAQCGSIEDKSITGSKSLLLPSLGSKEKELEVLFKYNNQVWEGKIGVGNRPAIIGPKTPPRAHIMRRSKILKLIESAPSKRYEEVKSYIEFPFCDKNEQNLRNAYKYTSNDFDNASKALSQSREALQRLWESEEPGISLEEWLAEKKNEDRESIQSDKKIIEELLVKYEDCGREYKELKKSRETQEKRSKIMLDAKEAFFNNQLQAVDDSSTLIDVLKTANVYFQKNESVQICPVCENDIVIEQIKTRIAERLDRMSEQVELKDAYEKAKKEAGRAEVVVLSISKRFIERTIILLDFFYKNEIFDFISKIQTGVAPFWKEKSLDEYDLETENEAFAVCKSIKPYIEELKEKRERLTERINQLNLIRNYMDLIKENETNSKYLEVKSIKLKALLDVVEQERKEFVESLLLNIANTVEKFYTIVHPDEEYGKIEFSLKKETKGSLEFKGSFCNYDGIFPQAYFSESHLDTLGICIYIALAKHFSSDNDIVILDDVLTSIDQQHLDRFLQMLHTVSDDFNQLIITTHYRSWYDRYKYSKGPTSNVQLVQLLPWTLAKGIRHTKTKIFVDELIELCESEILDRQAVASKAGILLECLLDDLTLKYGCRLPRQAEPAYSLQVLHDGIGKKLRENLRIETKDNGGIKEEMPLNSILSTIGDMISIRNKVGAHFNQHVTEPSDEEVRQMGTNTIEFAKMLICADCGQLPSCSKSGSYWECKCKKTALHPLIQKG
jgi:energy-coupling factor transporter ATP-binding protein EcfA2